MSCYFRRMADVLEEAGIDLEEVKTDKDKKKELDRKIHGIVGVEYKNCSPTWARVKEMLAEEGGRSNLIKKLSS
jgi:hypothetical protein